MMRTIRRSLACTAFIVVAVLARDSDHWTDANKAFELHNYASALASLDEMLPDSTPAVGVSAVQALRAQCLFKLRRWDEGVAVMESLFKSDPSYDARPDLHLAVADAAARRHGRKASEINHLRIAYRLLLEAGDRTAAATAAVRCGHAFINFTQWEDLDPQVGPLPKTQDESRVLRQRLAVKWFDRGIELADGRAAASTMYRKGMLYIRELRLSDEDTDRGVTILQDLVERWPDAPEAPMALVEIGRVYEYQHHDFVAAAKRYRTVLKRYATSRIAGRASAMLKNIETPVIQLGVEGPVLPGERGKLQLTVRNVPKLTFTAHRVDLFDLIRDIGHPAKLQEWKPKDRPIATWSVTTPDHGAHNRYSTRDDTMPAVEVPLLDTGAYVVTATPDATTKESVRGVTLLVVSKLAVISKGSRGGGLTWTVDAASGAPVGGATVMVQETIRGNTYRYRDGVTDASGLFIDPASQARNRAGRSLLVFARDGDDFAASRNSSFWYWWGFPGDYRAYSFTDRPVYRPDQEIHFKHILRRYDHGRYSNLPNQQVEVTVFGPKGASVYEQTLVTSEHGSVTGDIRLPPAASLGVYRMQLKTAKRFVDGGAGARFRVEEYRKPEFEVTVSAAKPIYNLEDEVEVEIAAKYYFGSPVSGAALTYTVSRSPIQPRFRYPSPYRWYFD